MNDVPSRDAAGRSSAASGARWPRALAVVAGLLVTSSLFVALYRRQLSADIWILDLNPAAIEAQAWWNGRLDLPQRVRDSAWVPDRHRAYNVYPPLQTIIFWLLVSPLDGHALQSIPAWAVRLVFLIPAAAAGYAAFLAVTRSVLWAVLWTVAWGAGTSLVPAVVGTWYGRVYHINHVWSQIGLLLIAVDLLGKRRIWPALIGLLIASWTRQLTLLYAPAIFMVAWYLPQRRRAAVGLSAAALAVIVGVPMALNAAKFGSPFDSGYQYIYHGRDDPLARNAREFGVFSTHYVARNAYYMNLCPPTLELVGGRPRIIGHPRGNSIWLSTPILALVWISTRKWWRDVPARMLMLCSCVIIAALLCYHTTGWQQPGYYRFALDFVPIWMCVAAAGCSRGWWGRCAFAATLWGVAYFALLAG